ncbi:cell division protein FtsZ, partial [Escherichia coli]|nr:cell division protein FtsZ [Escherichia coli]
MKRSASLATRANTEVSFAVVNCRVKTLNCEDQ